MANRRNLVRVLGVFIEDLQEFQLALEKEDLKAIAEFFEKAKQRRDQRYAGQIDHHDVGRIETQQRSDPAHKATHCHHRDRGQIWLGSRQPVISSDGVRGCSSQHRFGYN